MLGCLWLASALAMTPAEQATDINAVRELVRAHPAYDNVETAQQLDDALAAVPMDTDSAPHRFYGRLRAALALLDDGHTDAIMDGPVLDAFLSDDRFLPYDAMVHQGALYLNPRFHEPARVVSIDGHSGPDIVAELRRHAVADGPRQELRDADIDRYFANRYAQVYGFSETYNVVLDPSSPEGTAVAGVGHELVPYIGDPGPNAVKSEDGVLWITLNEQSQGREWRPFWRQLRKGVRTANGVVLDMRDCGGGFGPTNAEIMGLFASEPASWRTQRRLGATFGEAQPETSTYRSVYAPDASGAWAPKPHLADALEVENVKSWRHAWTGSLVVIVGNYTFSACSDLASALVATREDVVVVGQETSGGARRIHAAQFETRTLEASGIIVQVPLVELTSPDSFGDLGRGVIPTHPQLDHPDTEQDEVTQCARRLAAGQDCG